MASGGFYAIESHRISFGRDGEWYSDGERITNRRIASLFSRSIRRAPDAGYLLQVGDEKAQIDVEDTPFVVRQIETPANGKIQIELNDGTQEPLDIATIHLRGEVLYCRVKGGEFDACFLRAAQVAIARLISPTEDGSWALETADGPYVIPVSK